jgi:hypothetical protein
MSDPSLTTVVLSVATVALSGFCSIAGVFAGARLARRSEYDKWHRQEKSKALAEFLSELYNTRIAASDAYYSGERDNLAKSIKAGEAFAALRKYQGVARLYMSDNGRDSLEQLVSDLRLNCTDDGGPAKHSTKVEALMKSIQELVETELALPPGKSHR